MTVAPPSSIMHDSQPSDGGRTIIWRLSGRITAVWFSAVMLAVVLLPQSVVGDDAVRRVMLNQLAEGIKPDTKYSFIQPMVSLPLFWVFDNLQFGIYAVTLLPIIWMSVWSYVVWRVLARELSVTFAHHVVVLTVASMIGASLIGFSSDVFTALLMSGGVIVGLLARSRVGRVAAWTVFVVGAANTPVMFVATTVMVGFLVVGQRRIRYAALPVAVFVLMVIEATVVSGRLGWTRYTNGVEHGVVPLLPWGDVQGFGWPLWSGLLAVLFSFGRGVVFFIPTLWNGVTTASGPIARAEHALWALLVTLVPIYATWWAWFGGVSFGPRFFMIGVVPAAMATSSLLCRTDRSVLRSVVGASSVVLSSWVAISGAVFGVTTTAFQWCASGGGFNNFALCLYTPEYSGLWAPIWAADPAGSRDLLFALTVCVFVAPTLWPFLSPTIFPFRRQTHRLRTHLVGRWSL